VLDRRRGDLRLSLLPALLAAVALAASACSHTPSHTAPLVLGQPSGTPLVLGQPAPKGTGDLGAVSCATAARCWAVGVAGPNASAAAPNTVIAATTDGGLAWSAQRVTGGLTPELSGISCPTTAECLAVGSNGSSLPGGGIVLATHDGGAVWSQVASPAGAFEVTTVQCVSATSCTAIVSNGTVMSSARTTDLGQTWLQEGNLPALFVGANDLSCTGGGICLVPGFVPTGTGHGEGSVALSADGGQTWALATVPSGLGLLQSATCTTVSLCLAVGTTTTTVSDVVPAQGQLLRSADGGHTWTPAAQTLHVDDAYDVACPSPKVCAVVGTDWSGQPVIGGGAVAQSRDGGLTFRASSSAYVPLTLTGLACPTTKGCVAVGGDTVARVTLIAPVVVPSHSIRARGSLQG
jgi:photosystem II stability/assembly factor-like uncharacterized protein